MNRPARIAALLLALLTASIPGPARGQEYDDYSAFVPDSVFATAPKAPVSYYSSYNRDESRGTWSQNIGYARTLSRFAISVEGGTSLAEDLLRLGSKSTTGDLSGRVNWRASDRLVLTMSGASSMSSISDGTRSSTSEQRRNRLGLQGQYRVGPFHGARLTILGSSEYQHNYDLRNTERLLAGPSGSLDSAFVQRDSAYFSGRQDALRGQFDWALTKWLQFGGVGSGSWVRPTTDVRSIRSTAAADGSGGYGTDTVRSERLPNDNSGLEGKLSMTKLRATRVEFFSRRRGTDQVYFDLGQLAVEQYSNDIRTHSFLVETAALPKTVFTLNAAMNRSLRDYQARPNLNALVTSREVKSTVAYSTPGTMAFANFTVNRTRAEQQATGNGIVLSRALSTNVSQRLLGRFYLFGLGSATLFSYRYDAPEDDRDIASAFGSAGVRFAVTPHCSTSVNLAVSRVHSVSIDASRSSGNLSTTVYQLNGLLRMPLSRNLSIGQDYILSATYRLFDYDEDRNDLSRNFRIDTIVADTLSRFAFLRLDHRYFFFDRGDFTPVEAGGVRLYGIQQKQFQQTLVGTIGLRPVPGITLIAKQSLSDTDNRDILTDTRRGTQQWNLSLGMELNRSFWDGAGLTGAVRRESRYQNVTSEPASINEEEHWLVAISFQKDF